MFRISEVLNLLLALGLLPIIASVANRMRVPAGRGPFIAAYLTMLAAYVFTNLESVIVPELFDLLEHVCYAGSGVLFVFAARGAAAAARDTGIE